LTNEQEFLNSYDFKSYDRPSVASDIVAFTIRDEASDDYRHDVKKHLSILLIKRGEFPYKSKWALPGGFLKMDETMEECAARELLSETGLKPDSLFHIGVFSDINRDPRGRIVSNAYASIVTDGYKNIKGGDDAVEARWFDVYLKVGNMKLSLKLVSGDIELNASGDICVSDDGIVSHKITDTDLAFDHADIISTAVFRLRRKVEGFGSMLFKFLPEEFTLSELQSVCEIISDRTELTPNFRRVALYHVERTGKKVAGAGHRPAELYRKKN
jgi:ADP-ribose pyrophosphatase YjhB (NUDIX family)